MSTTQLIIVAVLSLAVVALLMVRQRQTTDPATHLRAQTAAS